MTNPIEAMARGVAPDLWDYDADRHFGGQSLVELKKDRVREQAKTAIATLSDNITDDMIAKAYAAYWRNHASGPDAMLDVLKAALAAAMEG